MSGATNRATHLEMFTAPNPGWRLTCRCSACGAGAAFATDVTRVMAAATPAQKDAIMVELDSCDVDRVGAVGFIVLRELAAIYCWYLRLGTDDELTFCPSCATQQVDA